MTGYEFLASALSSLAWPAVIGITLLVGRKKVSEFAEAILARVPNMSEFNAWSVSAKFADKARVLREETEIVDSLPVAEAVLAETVVDVTSEAPQQGSSASASASHPRFREDLANADLLLAVDPRAAVISAWVEVERAIQDRYETVMHTAPPKRPAMMLLKELASHDAGLPITQVKTIRELSSLRNALLHERNSHVTSDAAEDYLYTANSVIEHLLNSRTFPVS